MTPTANPKQSIFNRLRPPEALNYLILVGGGLAVYAFIMITRGNDVGALLAILLAVPGILARWTASPVLVLLLTAYLMIDPGFLNAMGILGGSHWFWPQNPSGFNLEDAILAAGLLAYSIGHYRLISLNHLAMPDEPTIRRERTTANPPRRPLELVGPEEFKRALIVGGCCVVVGQLAWTTLALIERFGRPTESEFSTGTSRFLLMVWVVGVVLMAVSAALVYLRSARMTRDEAMVVVRDVFFQENRRETDRLQRWRKWFKEKVAKSRRSGK